MSCFLMINSWAGSDQSEATQKMARVFRMDPNDADAVVDNLANGNPWQFDHQVSDQQSEVAEPYLKSLGFDVERIPVVAGDDFGMPMMDAGMGDSGGNAGGGLLGKIKGLFKRK